MSKIIRGAGGALLASAPCVSDAAARSLNSSALVNDCLGLNGRGFEAVASGAVALVIAG